METLGISGPTWQRCKGCRKAPLSILAITIPMIIAITITITIRITIISSSYCLGSTDILLTRLRLNLVADGSCTTTRRRKSEVQAAVVIGTLRRGVFGLLRPYSP